MNIAIKKTLLITLIATMLIAPSMTLMQAHASVPPLYDLTGTWTFNYYFGGTYTHTMMITSFNPVTGDFSGTGYYNANHLLNWTVTGTETVQSEGFGVSFHIAYNQSSYYVDATGHVYSNTYMDGSADGWNSPESYQGPATWDATKTNWSPDPNVQLNFPPGSDIQSVFVDTTTNYPPPPGGAIGPIYNITVTGTFGGFTPSIATSTTSSLTGTVTIGIHYDPNLLKNGRDESTLNLGQFDFLLGDVNHDGKVNLADLLIITKALFSTLGSRNWNSNADLNGDHKVDLKDLCLALKNFGKTAHWTDITTSVDTINNIVYGATDHFSGFGVH